MGSPMGYVVEMDSGVAAGLVARGIAQVEAQAPAAGRSWLPGGGPRTVALPRRQVAPVSPPDSQQRQAAYY